MAQAHAANMEKIGNMVQAMAAPKQLVRGPDGRAAGVVPANSQAVQ